MEAVLAELVFVKRENYSHSPLLKSEQVSCSPIFRPSRQVQHTPSEEDKTVVCSQEDIHKSRVLQALHHKDSRTDLHSDTLNVATKPQALVKIHSQKSDPCRRMNMASSKRILNPFDCSLPTTEIYELGFLVIY